ncbi:MAG: hypothetical protein M1832_004817 [Thelocarpon impressellum]|nr:MAG: hypothetical protein M1832_004817 [Thelocarpon impressellum]
MAPVLPRFHLLELHDQAWFPNYFREKIQACLTLVWNLHVAPLQTSAPAELVAAKLLATVPASRAAEYTFVDFCAGAGGPTPRIERAVNARLARAGGDRQARFVLTDLFPHTEAWAEAAAKSDNLDYVPEPVDATRAPADLLRGRSSEGGSKVFRMFNLSFHHFDDPLAREILVDTIRTSDGFGIFELQDRTLLSFVAITLIFPLLLLVSPFYFWRSPGHLFFTYVIPVIPLVLILDGWVSCLRTRTAGEVKALLEGQGVEGWAFGDGEETHTWPMGKLSYIVGVKK